MPQTIDPNRLPKVFSVFYSWQSDLPNSTNRRVIEKALTQALAKLKEELPDESETTFVLDSATRKESGTVDIANSILTKIHSSHAFVSDVTNVLKGQTNAGERTAPNPNICIELGYAAGILDWGRVVAVANTAFGRVPEDIPFDLRGRRLIKYQLPQDGDQRSAREKLKTNLYDAIRSIVEAHCEGTLKPVLAPEDEIKRARDLELLTGLMSGLHRSTVDTFLYQGAYLYFYRPFLPAWEPLNAVVSSP